MRPRLYVTFSLICFSEVFYTAEKSNNRSVPYLFFFSFLSCFGGEWHMWGICSLLKQIQLSVLQQSSWIWFCWLAHLTTTSPAFPLSVWSHADWITQISGSWGKNNHTNLADCMTSRTCCSRLSSCVLLCWPSTAAKILFYVTHRNSSLLSTLLSKPQSCLHQQGFQLLYWPCLLPQTATVALLYHILTAKTQLLDDMKLCDILLLHAAVVP